MAEEFRASRRKMKRYLIPIVIMLVLASGIVGCSQESSRKDEIEECVSYLEEIFPLGKEYLEELVDVLDADAAVLRAIESRNEQEFLEALIIGKDVHNKALNLVNSDISFLESITPPTKAHTLHNLMIESRLTARTGLIKLSYGTTIMYDKLYSLLFPSDPKKEYPSTAEEMRQGRQLIGEALATYDQVIVEIDNLYEILGIKTTE